MENGGGGDSAQTRPSLLSALGSAAAAAAAAERVAEGMSLKRGRGDQSPHKEGGKKVGVERRGVVCFPGTISLEESAREGEKHVSPVLLFSFSF